MILGINGFSEFYEICLAILRGPVHLALIALTITLILIPSLM